MGKLVVYGGCVVDRLSVEDVEGVFFQNDLVLYRLSGEKEYAHVKVLPLRHMGKESDRVNVICKSSSKVGLLEVGNCACVKGNIYNAIVGNCAYTYGEVGSIAGRELNIHGFNTKMLIDSYLGSVEKYNHFTDRVTHIELSGVFNEVKINNVGGYAVMLSECNVGTAVIGNCLYTEGNIESLEVGNISYRSKKKIAE